MNEILKQFLFNKNILVAGKKQEENTFETLFAIANLFGIKICKGAMLAGKDHISFLAKMLGIYVAQPFYKNFPKSVLELTPDQLLFDQLYHYYTTYGLGDFGKQGHSVFEQDFERIAFNEKVQIKEFQILTEDECVPLLEESVSNFLKSSRPLSNFQFDVVKQFIVDYKFKVEECASKDTAIRLLLSTRDLCFANFLVLSDVVKVVDRLNYQNYENKNIKKLNFSNKDRRFVSNVIDSIIYKGAVDMSTCFEKQAIWCGLLHHLHYKPTCQLGKEFCNQMRGGKNKSAYAKFEQKMEQGDPVSAARVLLDCKGEGALVRNLIYVISRCQTHEQIEQVLGLVSAQNIIVLIQLLNTLGVSAKTKARTFSFSKFNLLKVHQETDEEQKSRKTKLNDETIQFVFDVLLQKMSNKLKGKLGKVYISKEMYNMALPIEESTSAGGYGLLAKGSKIQLPETKKLRAFTYWEKVNDIDLSVIGVDEEGFEYEFSWRTMYGNQSKGITYSGDQTSGYNGGSEYFDINLPKFKKTYPKVRYLIFCDNVYSSLPFSEVVCRAGYMLRDEQDSGQVFEPKTVKSSFTINCDSTFAYMFGIDLKTNEFVWLNTSRNSSVIVAGQTSVGFLLEYFERTKVFNVGNFFEMMATQIVDDPALADVVVCDDINVQTKQDALVIKSFDFEKITALLQ